MERSASCSKCDFHPSSIWSSVLCVTKQEVKKAINSLNRNKAAGFYGITAENIVYVGDNLVKYLQEVLNKKWILIQ
jgi:hypothetical protein